MTTPTLWKQAVSSRFADLVLDLEVSDKGQVRKKANQKEFKYDQKDCYQCIKRKTKTLYLHTLVAETFLGLRPDGMVIDHIDGEKNNNASTNLRYTTVAENCKKGNKPLVVNEDGTTAIATRANARHFRENTVRGLDSLRDAMSKTQGMIEVLALQNQTQQKMIEDAYAAIHTLYMLIESQKPKSTQTPP
jgi:hypothetical protein